MSECDKEFRLISFKNICLGHQTDTAIKALRILKMFLFEILIVFFLVHVQADKFTRIC